MSSKLSVGCPVPVATSRLIVKNLPKYMTEKRVREHFNTTKGAVVTDVQLVRAADGRSRQFAFVGFKSVDEATRALKYFNRTFVDTSRISVDFAQNQADAADAVRPWSKYSQGSSAYARLHPEQQVASSSTAAAADDVALNAAAGAGDDAFAAKRREDELQAFMLASTAKKRKAWENDLAAPVAEQLAEQRRALKLTHVADQKLSARDAKRARTAAAVAATAPPPSTKTKAVRDPTPPPPEPAEPIDDAVVHNAAVSDLDYLKSRMVADSAPPPPPQPSRATNDDDDDSSSSSSSASSSSTSSSTPPLGNDADLDADANNSRLFVRNLPFSINENELIDYYQRFGALEDVHIPIDRETHEPRGFAYVSFVNALSAAQAQYETDGRIFQGRVLRVSSAKADKVAAATAAAAAAGGGALTPGKPGSYAKRKLEQLKADKSNAAVWASLFTRADAVASATADRLGVNKTELFAGSAGDAAVRLALGETQTIAETLNYFKERGVTVTPPPGECVRSKTAIIVKNLPYRCNIDQLRGMFARFGDVVQFLAPPSHTIALVQFAEVNFAKAAFNALAYAPFGDVPLFLEWAPEGLMPPTAAPTSSKPAEPAKPEAAKPETAAPPPSTADASTSSSKPATTRAHVTAPDDEEVAVERALAATQERTLFVRNLNFETTEESLRALLEKKLGRGAVVAPKIARDNVKKRSAGYGFVECKTRDVALKAYRTLQNVTLDGHALEFQLSKPKTPAAASASAADAKKKKARISETAVTVQSEKLAVKNIAFEATLSEVKQLFGAFGEIKKLRMPRKHDGTARGFAFVTYATKKEAQQAADTLKHTHFYGRHLVIEPAEE